MDYMCTKLSKSLSRPYPIIPRVEWKDTHVTCCQEAHQSLPIQYIFMDHPYLTAPFLLFGCLSKFSEAHIMWYSFDVSTWAEMWGKLSLFKINRLDSNINIKQFPIFPCSQEMVLQASTREPAWHVFARLACFLGLCLPLSIFLYSLTFLLSHFCLFTASLSLSFPHPPCVSVCSRRGMGWLSGSEVNCPFWDWPRSITATQSKQNESKGWIAGAVDRLPFKLLFLPLLSHFLQLNFFSHFITF